jgi:hypothetical protein
VAQQVELNSVRNLIMTKLYQSAVGIPGGMSGCFDGTGGLASCSGEAP